MTIFIDSRWSCQARSFQCPSFAFEGAVDVTLNTEFNFIASRYVTQWATFELC